MRSRLVWLLVILCICCVFSSSSAKRKYRKPDPTVNSLSEDAMKSMRLFESALAAEARSDFETAIRIYYASLDGLPKPAAAFHNIANAYRNLGLPDEAISNYRLALSHETNDPIYYFNFALALYDMKEVDAAIMNIKEALKRKPDFPQAYNNLGTIFMEQKRLEEAADAYRNAIKFDKSSGLYHYNLANTLLHLDQDEDALKHYKLAIKFDPNNQQIQRNMEIAEARRAQHRVLAAARNMVDDSGSSIASASDAELAKKLYAQAGQSYSQGDIQAAISIYDHAVALDPLNLPMFSDALLARHRACDWRDREANFNFLVQLVDDAIRTNQAVPITPMTSLSYPLNMKQLRAIARRWGMIADQRITQWKNPMPVLLADPPLVRGRLRIGYITSDVAGHTMSFLMQRVYELHDRKKFEVYFYALSTGPGYGREQTLQNADHFVDLTDVKDEEAARRIRADGIHILIDLDGWSHAERWRIELVAVRPAPVQISYLGFLGTMSASYIDAIVGDRVVIPPELSRWYDEKIIIMPKTYQVNDHRQYAAHVLQILPVPSRQEYNLPADAVVLTDFNQLYKVDPATWDMWMEILRQADNAVLWLLADPVAGPDYLRKEAEKRGIDPKRLIFMPKTSVEQHLSRARLADLFLDTPVYNAGTTCSDALFAGIPVLTLAGERYVARMSASLVTAAGFPELVVHTKEDYIAKAVYYAKNRDELRKLKRNLIDLKDSAPLFDTLKWVRDFERSVLMQYELHRVGLKQHVIVRTNWKVKQQYGYFGWAKQ
eukprot:TRINITY_DN3544_c0_g1_i1.p1 TRINITY_DN3544_c0_g1~~TRINITY_DN3544_c0_g1_i1.p1  ORF type:complete len:775 (+),score=156.97 TRINITY_DN3544_c0_g1_i1:36-2360(+)